MDAAHHAGKVHLPLRASNAQRVGLPHLLHGLGRANQGFAGHAAVVQAIAAHFVALNQGHLGLDSRRNVGRDQAARARANHHQVAVKALGARPARVQLARFQRGQDELGQQRKHPQQRQAAQQAGREHVAGRFNRRELGACIHNHRRAHQHAHLADGVELERPQRGQAHQQVDQPKREHRHQPQREQVQSAVLGQARVDGLQQLAKALLHKAAQQVARHPKSQQGA